MITFNADYSVSTTNSNSKLGTSTLDKNDFLKLLITELRNQDPLSPLDSKEYMTQLSQFSTLEQIQNLNLQLANLSAVNIVGKHAKALYQDNEISGIVSGVVFENGGVSVLLGDDEIKIPMENVYEIR